MSSLLCCLGCWHFDPFCRREYTFFPGRLKISSLRWGCYRSLGKPGTEKSQGIKAKDLTLVKPYQNWFQGSFRRGKPKEASWGVPRQSFLWKQWDPQLGATRILINTIALVVPSLWISQRALPILMNFTTTMWFWYLSFLQRRKLKHWVINWLACDHHARSLLQSQEYNLDCLICSPVFCPEDYFPYLGAFLHAF